MPTINYIGIVTNVDESIVDVKLDHGFSFVEMEKNEMLQKLSPLESLSLKSPLSQEFLSNLFFQGSNLRNGYIYAVVNTLEVDQLYYDTHIKKIANNYSSSTLGVHFIEIWSREYFYLENLFKKMNLYKEGSISLLISYYYSLVNNEYFLHEKCGVFPKLLHGRDESTYNLNKSEIKELELFLTNTVWPFKDNHLKLAYNSFEASITMENTSIKFSFLSLFLAIEILFNPGEYNKVTHKLCRNCAMLIGKNHKEKIEIYKSITDLYGKRSEIVHQGITSLNKQDILLLREYARQSIIEFYRQGKTKDEVLRDFKQRNFDNVKWNNQIM